MKFVLPFSSVIQTDYTNLIHLFHLGDIIWCFA